MAKLLFIGRLEDVAGAGEYEIRLERPLPVGALLQRLPIDLVLALDAPKVRLALNGTLVPRDNLVIADGDELAFLPPVSGG